MGEERLIYLFFARQNVNDWLLGLFICVFNSRDFVVTHSQLYANAAAFISLAAGGL